MTLLLVVMLVTANFIFSVIAFGACLYIKKHNDTVMKQVKSWVEAEQKSNDDAFKSLATAVHALQIARLKDGVVTDALKSMKSTTSH